MDELKRKLQHEQRRMLRTLSPHLNITQPQALRCIILQYGDDYPSHPNTNCFDPPDEPQFSSSGAIFVYGGPGLEDLTENEYTVAHETGHYLHWIINRPVMRKLHYWDVKDLPPDYCRSLDPYCHLAEFIADLGAFVHFDLTRNISSLLPYICELNRQSFVHEILGLNSHERIALLNKVFRIQPEEADTVPILGDYIRREIQDFHQWLETLNE